MEANNKKVIAFDWDGCLCDTQHLIVKAAEESFKTTKTKPLTEDEIKSVVCNSHQNLFNTVAKLMNISVPENAKDLYLENYDKLDFSDLKSFDGIKEILIELKKNYLLAIISTKPQHHLEREIETLEFNAYFDLVLGMKTMNDIIKPNPNVLNPILEKYGENSVILYVGDTISDYNFAKNCNLPFVGVSWGTEAENIKKSGCQYINKPIELLDIIKKYN